MDVLQSSRDQDKIRRLRAEIVGQHEPIMELLLYECALRFSCVTADIPSALGESDCLRCEHLPGSGT